MAIWADALEIEHKFYRNYRHCELSGMDVYSDYTQYRTYLLDFYDNRKLLEIGRRCGQWAWPRDMIRGGAYFPQFQPLS